jgi:hypothetical protein
MDQLDLFETPMERLSREVTELRAELHKIQRGAFAKINLVSDEVKTLTSHCEVMFDVLLNMGVC